MRDDTAIGALYPAPIIRDYWYLHKECRVIEKVLKAMGANIRWTALDMPFVLGFSIERDGYRRPYRSAEKRTAMFAPGLYARLYEQWRPALGALDATVVITKDIASISLSTSSHDNTGSPQPVSVQDKPGWNALRFDILKRDNYRCRLCGVAATDAEDVRLNVDHKIARAHGGSDHPENLWVLCWPCNIGKGVKSL